MGKKGVKIAIVGPESSGKSTLAAALAARFGAPWAPEFAREYLENLGRPYGPHDLPLIARGQLAAEALHKDSPLLICDTNLLVIKVWSEFKYGFCDPEILENMHLQRYDLQLLTLPDIAWEPDPLREHPQHRQLLFDIYRRELEQAGAPFVYISGPHAQRLRIAADAVESLLK